MAGTGDPAAANGPPTSGIGAVILTDMVGSTEMRTRPGHLAAAEGRLRPSAARRERREPVLRLGTPPSSAPYEAVVARRLLASASAETGGSPHEIAQFVRIASAAAQLHGFSAEARLLASVVTG